VNFVTPTWTNTAAASTLRWDLVNATSVGYLTGFASPSATSTLSQNGSPGGSVNSYTIDPDGTIVGALGSGQTISVGRLALASFNNPKGLSKAGNNAFSSTQAAGFANIGTAGTGGRGTLVGSAVEQSNVDIAQEFTQMILAQRGYQASSKSITVADELMLETLNLKR
jgi:flagellar hook protein FlgE